MRICPVHTTPEGDLVESLSEIETDGTDVAREDAANTGAETKPPP